MKQPWENDPVADKQEPWASDQADTAVDQSQAAPVEVPKSDLPGFSEEQKKQILDYIPKATDAADLERFSSELTQGRSKIGNAQAVLDAYAKGHRQFGWTPPAPRKAEEAAAAQPSIRDKIGDALVGALDAEFPGIGAMLRTAREDGSGKAFTEHAANALAFDYGPEVGGLIDTVLHPSSNLDNNVAHERATMEGDSQGHDVASILGELTGAGLTGAVGGEAGLANLGRGGKVAATLGEGALYGSGAAGPGHRAEGAVTGAALAGATDTAIPLARKFIAARQAGDMTAAAEAAKAANELGIDLPRFVVGGEGDAQRASALEQTIGGRKPISDATAKMLNQAEAARTSIASDVGAAAEPAAIGDEALNAAIATNKSERKRIGGMYDRAKTIAAGATVQPVATRKVINDLIANEREVPGGTKVLPILERYEKAFQEGSPMSIEGARGLRTELRTSLRDEAGATPDNADRITNLIMGGVNADMKNGLQGQGNDLAWQLYKAADTQWAKQRTLEDDVLKPFLGKEFDNWGEDVAKKINSDAKGNGTRLARFLGALPEEQANNVRASLIMHLGSATDGAQNAAGDAFTLDRFLTNWSQIKGSRNLIFPKEIIQSLDKLAKVADAVKTAGRTKNRSNTAAAMGYILPGLLTTGGAAETFVTHDPRGIAVGLLTSALNTVRQYGAAKLLASPAFAKKLAATPLNPAGAKAFWSRPWVKAMQLKNPAIAGEIQAFQSAFLRHANDNSGIVSSAAASPDQGGQTATPSDTFPP